MNKTLKSRIQNKRGTDAEWKLATNFVPLKGEQVVYEADSDNESPRIKIGDGNTNVNSLPFAEDVARLSSIPNNATVRSANFAMEGEGGTVGNQTYEYKALGWAEDDVLNLEDGSGANSIQQKRDAGYTGIAIKTKNPNAYTLDNTLTDNEPIGATGDYASSFGGASSAQGKRSLAEGTNTVAKGRYSHAEGCNSVTLGDDSHAEGGLTVAGAIAAHSEGWETQAVEEYSHAEGYRTIAAGSGSHAEGGMTYANAKYSHTEGVGNKSSIVLPEQGGGGGGTEPPPTESESPDELLGAYAHVEGIYNTVYGYGSHAEGQGNIVYGHRSHAEGRNTVAGRIDRHADGSRKVAGECIHTEGLNTVASGDYSHAEGANTKAIGAYSHAAGANTEAHKAYSTAIGFYTTTEGGSNYSFVTGKYNIKGYSNALFAVGNGSSDTDRKNAFTVLTDGRAKVQSAPKDNDDVIRKQELDALSTKALGIQIDASLL